MKMNFNLLNTIILIVILIFACYIILQHYLKKQIDSKINNVKQSVENAVKNSVENAVKNSVENAVKNSVENAVKNSVENVVTTTVPSMVENAIINLATNNNVVAEANLQNQLNNQLNKQLDKEILNKLKLPEINENFINYMSY